jgi:uncharacterized protein (TIGR03435 family)
MTQLLERTLTHPSQPIRCLSFTALLFLVCGLVAAMPAHAQMNPAPKPFDVAAIKPNNSGGNTASIGTSHGRLTVSNVTARAPILKAFRLTDVQLSGGSDWINTERFDISAKIADQSISDDDLWLSLQPLLIERFHLKFHRGTRQAPVLSLVTDKVKPELVPHIGTQAPSMRISNGGGKTSLDAKNISMAKFATTLAGFTSHVAVDNTRLNGGFDFKLEWAQDHPEESTLSSIEESLGMTGPSLYTALQGAIRAEAPARDRPSRKPDRRLDRQADTQLA